MPAYAWFIRETRGSHHAVISRRDKRIKISGIVAKFWVLGIRPCHIIATCEPGFSNGYTGGIIRVAGTGLI